MDKMAGLLAAGGALIVVEFAWERLEEATAEWALERLPAASPSGHKSWLERCCGGCEGGGGRRDDGNDEDDAEAHFTGGPRKASTDSRTMRGELERRFVERHFEWVPYLYPDLADYVSEADEGTAIEAGTINATGFRYVGIVPESARIGGVADRKPPRTWALRHSFSCIGMGFYVHNWRSARSRKPVEGRHAPSEPRYCNVCAFYLLRFATRTA